MRTLSKDAERKLISAIEKAAALVNDGTEPTAAIIKSAEEHAVPAGHINLMVHAYNTGATTAQREKGESTLEKAADFRLADAQAVLKALYPETVKSSSARKRAEIVSTEYAISASAMLARRRDGMQKAAAAQVTLPEKTWTAPPRDEHAAVMRGHSEKIAAQRAEEETRRQATVAYSKAAAALEDLNVYFRTPGNMSFGDALREVNVRLGEAGVSVLQKVAAVYPHFNKQAATKRHHFGHDSVYDLVQNVLDSVSVYNDAQAKVSVKKSEAVSQKTAPQFLTGSILAEKVDEPLTLKSADRKGGPGTNPLGDRAKSTGGSKDDAHIPPMKTKPSRPAPPPPPSLLPDALDSQVDELVTNGLGGVPDAEAAKNIQNDEEEAYGQSYRDLWRQGQATVDNRQKDREYDEKLQDALFNESENKRVQQERDEAYARKLREEDLANEQADAARSMDEDAKQKAKKKERQETWDKGKSIGQDLGKSFKGDFLGNATAPVKLVGNLLGTSNPAADIFKSPDPSKVLKEQYQQLAMDPTHENALKTIRAKSVLHDMVLNDPVISGYDPQDVAMAFNEIAELAPSLVDTPGMIRPLLRKRLEAGQLADFDVKQILDMDKLRADRDRSIADMRQMNLNALT